MNDKWTILLTGPSNGLVGSLGESFKNSPRHYERVDVVRADRYDRLREALEECRDVMEAYNRAPGASRDEWEFECEVKEIGTLLAQLQADKGGE